MTGQAEIRVAPRRDRSLQRRHPWIFSGAVDEVIGSPQPGATVLVRSADGSALGWAAYSPESQIRARMWTFDPDEAVTAEFVAARVSAAAARRADLLGPGLTGSERFDSARVVFSEADGVPGLTADRYGDTVVCQLTTVGAETWRDVLADALAGLPGIRCVYERSDADARQREGIASRVGALRGPAPHPETLVHEDGLRFAVDVAGGHKTGFYLDQRDSRGVVATWAPGRRVLNVFSYTGAFGIVAARHGAQSVTSIDSSRSALDLGVRNATLNGVEAGECLEGDAFTVLRGLRDRARQYDLILLDPPKLAHSDRQLDKASRAYKDLNLLALKLLAPDGVLMTWSCSGSMPADLFRKVVAGAALDAGRDVRVVGHLHQPGDHPIPLTFPEAEYLKGLVLR